MSTGIKLLLVLMLGLAIGAASVALLHGNGDSVEQNQDQPLYWVAPMDANYRRDGPGKSPMGMDLVPVYEKDVASDSTGAGVVTIAPHVVQNLGVRTAPVVVGPLDTEITTVGYVQYDEDQLVHIHPRVAGWIEKLYVSAVGSPVEKGQPLYTLYSPQLVNAQEEFLIALKRDNALLVKAAKERLQSLQLPASFISELQRDKAVRQTVTFFSPQSGVVDGLKIREGFFVEPGNTLMSIGQLDEVWVEAEVFERDAAIVEQNQPVTMTLDFFPGKVWRGVVDYVYPTLNPQTRTLRVRLRFDNPEHLLKPNMFAQVTIHAEPTADSLLVPKQAVIRTGSQDRVVLALGEGEFKSVAVEIGRVSDQRAEILSGLKADDVVVSSAQFLIDSESSKTSDFSRMQQQTMAPTVWLEGNLNRVMASHRMLNITHEPVPEWQWPAMTMDFSVSEQVDMQPLEAGQTLHFEVTRSGDDYVVSTIHIASSEQAQEDVPRATVDGVINYIQNASRIVNISRGPIEKWDRPATTMDFIASKEIDLQRLAADMKVRFTFEIRDDFVITNIAPQPDAESSDHAHH